MCIQRISKRSRFYRLPIIYLIVIFLGIFSGLSEFDILKDFGMLISDIFIKFFKCIGIPLIALSIIINLSNYNSDILIKNIWKNTLFYTISTTIISAINSCIIYLIINPKNINIVTENMIISPYNIGYFQYIVNIIPSSILYPFLENQVIGVFLIGSVIGISIRYIQEEDVRKTIIDFFKGSHSIFLVISNWIVMIIPLGLYGFITITVSQFHSGFNIKSIGDYLLVIILSNLVQGFIILPLWLSFNNIKPFKMMIKMLPALSIAFFSKSSVVTLPVTIKIAEKELKIDPTVSKIVLPICTTINMNGCASFIFTTVIYLMQNNGFDITINTMILWIIISTIAAIGNAGVPMGCFFLSTSLLSSMNIPITLLGLILPFYVVIDMLETALNVWSDSCVAKIVDKKLSLK